MLNTSTFVCLFLDHNKTHAADVLHAVSYLLFEIIPEFSHEFSYEDSQREWKVRMCISVCVFVCVGVLSWEEGERCVYRDKGSPRRRVKGVCIGIRVVLGGGWKVCV